MLSALATILSFASTRTTPVSISTATTSTRSVMVAFPPPSSGFFLFFSGHCGQRTLFKRVSCPVRAVFRMSADSPRAYLTDFVRDQPGIVAPDQNAPCEHATDSPVDGLRLHVVQGVVEIAIQQRQAADSVDDTFPYAEGAFHALDGRYLNAVLHLDGSIIAIEGELEAERSPFFAIIGFVMKETHLNHTIQMGLAALQLPHRAGVVKFVAVPHRLTCCTALFTHVVQAQDSRSQLAQTAHGPDRVARIIWISAYAQSHRVDNHQAQIAVSREAKNCADVFRDGQEAAPVQQRGRVHHEPLREACHPIVDLVLVGLPIEVQDLPRDARHA